VTGNDFHFRWWIKKSQHLHCCSLVPRTDFGYELRNIISEKNRCILCFSKIQLTEKTFSIAIQKTSRGKRILAPLQICQFITCSAIIKRTGFPVSPLAHQKKENHLMTSDLLLSWRKLCPAVFTLDCERLKFVVLVIWYLSCFLKGDEMVIAEPVQWIDFHIVEGHYLNLSGVTRSA